MAQSMDDQEADLRRWAIEQSVKMHTPNSRTIDFVLSDARQLLEFVKPPAKQK